MTLQDIGRIGEFLAAIATLATLVYLAAQILQNTASVKSAAAQSVLEALNQAVQPAASSPQQARVVFLGQTDHDQLSDDERMQFSFYLLGWFRILELAHHNYLQGHLDSALWEGHSRHLGALLQAPSIRRWWKIRSPVFSEAFREFVDGLDGGISAPTTSELLEAIRRDYPAA